MLEIRLLGAFEVRCGGEVVHIPGRHEQSLFAYLVLNSGAFQRREKLASLLWADASDEASRDNFRHILWRMRKALPLVLTSEYLLVDDFFIVFNASAHCWLDISVLKTAAKYNSADDLISALSVYRGELLPGFYDNWVMLEREYLNYIFEHNMARLLAALQAENRWLDVME